MSFEGRARSEVEQVLRRSRWYTAVKVKGRVELSPSHLLCGVFHASDAGDSKRADVAVRVATSLGVWLWRCGRAGNWRLPNRYHFIESV